MNSDTMFAPAVRADHDSVWHDADRLARIGLIDHVTYVIPSILLILNRQRQVVYKNQRLTDFLGASSDEKILGKRPGELLDCIHATERAAGCGTTEFCRECGAVKAILKSQNDTAGVMEECRITSKTGDAYEFRVWASPFTFEKRDYTVFTVLDIRHEKRREALEQTFFHDLNNIITSVAGHSELLSSEASPAEIMESAAAIHVAIKELSAEIDSHRKLLAAEDGKLALEIEHGLSAFSILDELIKVAHQWWPETRFIRRKDCSDFLLTTDRSLLHRVLFNMVKNAAEAAPREDTVSIGCFQDGRSGVFGIHSNSYMPRSVQLQVFQRSFSTKGRGRGLGTYSMKLFGEKYLRGRVWFSTAEDEGTVFYLSIPLSYAGE